MFESGIRIRCGQFPGKRENDLSECNTINNEYKYIDNIYNDLKKEYNELDMNYNNLSKKFKFLIIFH